MSSNRQFLRDAAAVAGLHESILLIQTALAALRSGAEEPPTWRGRSLFGLSSLCPEPTSRATLTLNGVRTPPILLDHARPLDNRRRILFALNAISPATGVTAHPDHDRPGLVRIRPEASPARAICLQVETSDPTEYWSATHQRIPTVLGSVLISDERPSPVQTLPRLKTHSLALSATQTLALRLPCEEPSAMSEDRRRPWSLALQASLLSIQGLSDPR